MDHLVKEAAERTEGDRKEGGRWWAVCEGAEGQCYRKRQVNHVLKEAIKAEDEQGLVLDATDTGEGG